MKKSSLLLSNPYLKDPAVRDALLRQTVISSSAIEGVNKTVASQALDLPAKASSGATLTDFIELTEKEKAPFLRGF